MTKHKTVVRDLFSEMKEFEAAYISLGYEVSSCFGDYVISKDEDGILIFMGFNPKNKIKKANITLVYSQLKKLSLLEYFENIGGKRSASTNNIVLIFDGLDEMKEFIKTKLLKFI